MNENNVGRPVTKLGRKKIGLSLDGITSDLLDELSSKLGKTKSKIVEESILLYYKNNQIIEEEIKKIDRSKNDPYYMLKDMLYNSSKDRNS